MSHQDLTLSIIVPALNEEANIIPLLTRIHASVAPIIPAYEVIFIDDHSTDATYETIQKSMETFPVRLYRKQGAPGKAQSLLEGFALARGTILCMIDADLQYPPEAIPHMAGLIAASTADVVLSRRVQNDTGLVRKLSTWTYNLIFARLLLGLNYDTQAGLKVFRRTVIETITLDPSPWSFDMEFIVRSLQRGHALVSYDIAFSDRQHGKGKINLLATTFELSRAALKIRSSISRREIRQAYKKNMRLELTKGEGAGS